MHATILSASTVKGQSDVPAGSSEMREHMREAESISAIMSDTTVAE